MRATEFQLSGQLASRGFADWVCHRARLLDLNGWVKPDGPEAMTIVVTGPEPLVDAMEMACSLGPMDVWVERIESRVRILETLPNGFQKV